jgi:hypothetical protein
MRRWIAIGVAAILAVALAPGVAAADLAVNSKRKSVTVYQKHAERTTAYKKYKDVAKQPILGRGPLVPDPGLTARQVASEVRREIDLASPCAYFVQRDQYCQYQLADLPDSNPKKSDQKADPGTPASYVVQITPEQAALMAIASLQLPAVAPGIGPDPSINRWKMAAVGYPLWLWADGPTHVGPVSQSVANLHVSLDARLTSVSFEMGDGHSVNCHGPGTPWAPSIEAGTPSTCGYRYDEPSLPDGSYTIRAVSHWSIDWEVGGQSGTVTMDQLGTRQLPVGELQVLVR